MNVGRPPKGQSRSTDVLCATCGTTFRRYLAFVVATNFCGKACWRASLKGRPALSAEAYQRRNQRYVGDGNPNWRGGMATRKASAKLWQSKNGDSVRTRNANRRAKVRSADGSFTQAEWSDLKARHDYCCVHCGRHESVAKLTRDHIIPISKGGANWITNIQPLCLSCNSSKKDRPWAAEKLGVVIYV